MDVGEKLGKYDIRGMLGRGAMGVVYDGWDPLIERRVAIKTVRLLREDSDAEAEEGLARFRREAQAAGRLQHPNIVGIFDYGETSEFAYLVMEFVDGRTVKSVLDAQERFPIPEVARVMEELLDALQYSHEHGVVHRDIKPANMILTRNGRVKVADFGVARIESSSMTQVGTVIGTPAYMSPEQLAGQTVDSRSDIYSAGVVLYQLLTGDRPYHGNNLTSIYHQALNSEPVPPSKIAMTVPPAFDPVVARAMAKRPQERYATAAQFAAAIGGAATEQTAAATSGEPDATVVSRPTQPASPPASRPRAAPPPSASGPAAAGPPPAPARTGNRTVLFAAVAGAVLLLVGGGTWYVTQPGPVAPTPEPNKPAPPVNPIALAPTPPVTEPSRPTPPVNPVAQTPTPHIAEPSKPTPSVNPVAQAPTPAPPVQEPTKPAPPVNPIAQVPPTAPIAEPSKPTPPIVQAPTPPPPSNPSKPAPSLPVNIALAPGALRSAIAAAVAPVGCALVSGDVADPGGNVSLTGLAGHGTPLTELHRAVTDAAPTAAVDWRVASFDGPYCRALDVLHPAAAGFGVPASGFTMGLRSGKRPLTDRELITVDLTMPDFPAWLVVDYLQHDGTIVHLYPTAKDPAHVYAAGSHPSLGDPATGGERWEVGEPYGTDMIIAVASSAPLFTQKRKDLEQADDYLRALQGAIESAQHRKVRMAADALVLTTEPRR